MSIDSNLICTCGEGTWAYFASIQLSKAQLDQDRDFTRVKGDSGFSIAKLKLRPARRAAGLPSSYTGSRPQAAPWLELVS